jgi:hypothetical protein
MFQIMHVKLKGFVSGLLVIRPAYSDKEFEELIKSRLSGGRRSPCEGLV